MASAVDAKELGTLIVVVGKARNLPNKSRFGKQDPFCTVVIGDDKQKTKPIKRGGQHPEWDEEFRFAIYEDIEDTIQRSESQSNSLSESLNGRPTPTANDPGVVTSAALASKSRKQKKKGGRAMRITCYADDVKEPELIGECAVSLDDVLKKGEVDEWYEFQYKDKYSGELYLELTFFSNDAPPVRRNVPRPSIPSYSSGASGSAVQGALPTLSGTVSGAKLYIPPYAQPAVRGSSPGPKPLPTSASFAELGLPPRQQPGAPMPPSQHGQQRRQPGHTSSSSLSSHPSIDVLTRPMSSLSLATSVSTQSLAPASLQTPVSSQSLSHSYSHHRHSFGGASGVPWENRLPQSQPQPAPTPHPRPMSSNDVVAWEQSLRQESERLRLEAERIRAIGATPVPRPASGQSLIAPGQAPYGAHMAAHQDYRAPSPIPENIPASLRPAAPPQPHLTHQPYSQPPPTPAPVQYPHQPPTPAPPIHSHSAPLVNQANGAGQGHYQVPTSSFGGLAQPPTPEPRREPSPGPGYSLPPQVHQSQMQPTQGQYQSLAHSGYTQQAPSQQQYGTPTRKDSYPSYPQEYQQTPPPPQTQQPYTPAYTPHPSQTPQPYYQTPPVAQSHHSPAQPHAPQHSQTYSQSAPSPVRSSSPQQVQHTSQGGYVPWWQQTQSAPEAQPPRQEYEQEYSQPVLHHQPYGQHAAVPSHSPYPPPTPAPPVPERRPQSQPPHLVKQSVGYYPSDELYAQRQDAQTPVPQMQPQSRPQQAHQGWQPQESHEQQQQQQQQWQTPPLSHPGQPPQQPQPSWQAQQPQDPYGRGQIQQQSNPYGRTPSPQPPVQQSVYAQPPVQAQNPYQRSPSPQPPLPYSQSAYQLPTSSSSNYNRAPSPQPSAQSFHTQPQSYLPPYPQQSETMQSPGDWQQSNRAASPGVHAASLAQSASAQRQDWRTYLNNALPVNGSSAPERAPSPQPPPKDDYSLSSAPPTVAPQPQYQPQQPPPPGQQQQQQQPPAAMWYAPPPSMPESIRPPEGWQPTLHTRDDGRPW